MSNRVIKTFDDHRFETWKDGDMFVVHAFEDGYAEWPGVSTQST